MQTAVPDASNNPGVPSGRERELPIKRDASFLSDEVAARDVPPRVCFTTLPPPLHLSVTAAEAHQCNVNRGGRNYFYTEDSPHCRPFCLHVGVRDLVETEAELGRSKDLN